MINYTLSDAEFERVVAFSKQVIKTKLPHTVEKYKMDGRADGEDRLIRNIEGYMGEFAVSKHYNVPFSDEVVSVGGDSNFDLKLFDYRVGVKSTRYTTGSLLVKKEELFKSEVPFAFFLCIVNVKAKKVSIIGYAKTSFIKNLKPVHIRKDTEPVYKVEQKLLKKIKHGIN
jgi:hypothetical protein